ncbi:hypothetical protein C0J52_27382, partial [Blattella germanica]
YTLNVRFVSKIKAVSAIRRSDLQHSLQESVCKHVHKAEGEHAPPRWIRFYHSFHPAVVVCLVLYHYDHFSLSELEIISNYTQILSRGLDVLHNRKNPWVEKSVISPQLQYLPVGPNSTPSVIHVEMPQNEEITQGQQ